jgi:hypothetical protein
MLTDLIRGFELWLDQTALSALMVQNPFVWPAAETIHFLGLTLLIGTVGLFDLRLLGFLQNLEPRALHRLVPWGVAGYGINVITGTLFLAGTPDQYLYNPAFHFKMLFMFLTGVNVLFFYRFTCGTVWTVEAGGSMPRRAKLIGGISLVLWLGIITCGRLLTFYRP